MNEKKLKQYAKLIVEEGLNVQAGQPVLIRANIEMFPLVREITKAAYERKAKDVIVKYRDEVVEHEHNLQADPSCFETIPSYESDFYNQLAQENGSFLTLVGDDPDLMKDVDPKKIVQRQVKLNQATKTYRDRLEHMQNAWCVAAAPTRKWAQKIFPELNEQEAVESLWEAIFKASRVEETGSIENWKEHQNSFEKRVEWLNGLDLRSLHYTNSLGTDLVVELPEHYVFDGGGSNLLDKEHTSYSPNIPTEEVFSAPYKYGVNGKVYGSLPLVYNGNKIEDFYFVFKNGKVVDFKAKEGKEVLKEILSVDEGASYLGEVALVPKSSPIFQMHTLFYNTLFDENAASHFALGNAYLECVENGLFLSEKALEEAGLNASKIHVDFMVGTEDLTIVGKCKDGKEILLFKEGQWGH